MDWAPWASALATAETSFAEASKIAEEKLEEAKALALGTPIIKAKPNSEDKEEEEIQPQPLRTWELEEADDDEVDSVVEEEEKVEKAEEVEPVPSETTMPVMDSNSTGDDPTPTAAVDVPPVPAEWALDVEEEEEKEPVAALEIPIPSTLPEGTDNASNEVEVFHRRSFKRSYDFPHAPPSNPDLYPETSGDGQKNDRKEIHDSKDDARSKSTVDELLEESTNEPPVDVSWDSEDGELVSLCDFEESGDELDSSEVYDEQEGAPVEEVLPLPSEVTQQALTSFISRRLSSKVQNAASMATPGASSVASPIEQSRDTSPSALPNEDAKTVGEEAANIEGTVREADEVAAQSTTLALPESEAEASAPEPANSEVETSRGGITVPPELIYENGPPVTGASEKIGRRPTMEDKWSFVGDFVPSLPSWFVGVFDGHGGAQASAFVTSKLPMVLAASLSSATSQEQLVHDQAFVEAALLHAFEATDAELLAMPEESAAGCTATVCLKLGRKLYCANTGDSRTVLACGARDRANGEWQHAVKGQPLSLDQKPSDSVEKARIKERGGFVAKGRLMGELGVARAFGDRDYKKNIRTLQQDGNDGDEDSDDEDLGPEDPRNLNLLIATPEITVTNLDDASTAGTADGSDLASPPAAAPLFVLLACDGLWDVMSNDEACQFVATALDANGGDCSQALHALTDHAIEALGSSDNVTATMVLLQLWWQPQHTSVDIAPAAGDSVASEAELGASVESVAALGSGVEEEKKGELQEPAWLHDDGADNEVALDAELDNNADSENHAAAVLPPVSPSLSLSPPAARPIEVPEVSVDHILDMLRNSVRPSSVVVSETNDSNEPSQEWLTQPLPTARAVRGAILKHPIALPPAPHRRSPTASGLNNNSRTRDVASTVQSLLCETFVRDTAAQGAEHCMCALKEQLSQMDPLNSPKQEKSQLSHPLRFAPQKSTTESMARPEFLALQLAAVLIQTAARGVLARSHTTELFAAFNQHKQAGGFARSPIDAEAFEVVKQFEMSLAVLEDKLLAKSDVSPLSVIGLMQHLKQQVASLRSRVDRGGSNGSMAACASVIASIQGQIREVKATALPPSLPERVPAAGRRTMFGGTAAPGSKPKGRMTLIGTAKAAMAARASMR